jgi:hypothetical protein
MPLKFYGNLLSQPCRAVIIFLKANQIPYEFKFVDMAKGMLLNNTEYTVITCQVCKAYEMRGFHGGENVDCDLRSDAI